MHLKSILTAKVFLFQFALLCFFCFVDFRFTAFHALIRLLGSRPRSLINLVDAIFAEGNVEHILGAFLCRLSPRLLAYPYLLDYINDEPLYQLIVQKKLTAGFVAEYCAATSLDYVEREVSKSLKHAYRTDVFTEVLESIYPLFVLLC